MKYLIFLLVASLPFLSKAQTNLSNNLQPNTPKAVDNRTGKFSGGVWIPYTSTSDANTSISSFYRYNGLIVPIGTPSSYVEYWYYGGTADGNLVVKPVGGITDTTVVATKNYVNNGLSAKQNTLVSGTTLKTVNGSSLLGSGNVSVVADTSINTLTLNDYQGKNLYNPATNTTTGSGGSLIVKTDFIPVTPGLAYTLSGRLANVGVNNIQGFNSSFASTGDAANFVNGTFTPAAGTVYVQFWVYYNGVGGGSIQLEQSSSATSYEPYSLTHDIASVGSKPILRINQDTRDLINSKTAIIGEFSGNQNIYDKSKAIAGYFVDNAGGITANGAATWTGYVPAKPRQRYAITRGNTGGVNFIAAFDSLKNLIGAIDSFSYDLYTGETFVTPANTAYVGWTLIYSGGTLDAQVEEGFAHTPVVTYVAKKKILSSDNTAITAYTPEVRDGVKSQLSPWNGKKILWIGTSIPDKGEYPEFACQTLGATIYNEALESSFVRRRLSTGALVSNTTKSLSSTVSELIADGHTADTGNSYMRKLLPYKTDLTVFEMGFNDVTFDGTNFDVWPSNDSLYARNTFIGAMNYIISKKYQQDTLFNFCFITHHNNSNPALNHAIEMLASFWGVPCLKLYEKTGWTTGFTNPTTGNTPLKDALPDQIHTFSDPTNRAKYKLGRIVTQYLQSQVAW